MSNNWRIDDDNWVNGYCSKWKWGDGESTYAPLDDVECTDEESTILDMETCKKEAEAKGLTIGMLNDNIPFKHTLVQGCYIKPNLGTYNGLRNAVFWGGKFDDAFIEKAADCKAYADAREDLTWVRAGSGKKGVGFGCWTFAHHPTRKGNVYFGTGGDVRAPLTGYGQARLMNNAAAIFNDNNNVTTSEGCKAYADADPTLTWGSTGSGTGYTPGCYTYMGGKAPEKYRNKVYFGNRGTHAQKTAPLDFESNGKTRISPLIPLGVTTEAECKAEAEANTNRTLGWNMAGQDAVKEEHFDQGDTKNAKCYYYPESYTENPYAGTAYWGSGGSTSSVEIKTQVEGGDWRKSCVRKDTHTGVSDYEYKMWTKNHCFCSRSQGSCTSHGGKWYKNYIDKQYAVPKEDGGVNAWYFWNGNKHYETDEYLTFAGWHYIFGHKGYWKWSWNDLTGEDYGSLPNHVSRITQNDYE